MPRGNKGNAKRWIRRAGGGGVITGIQITEERKRKQTSSSIKNFLCSFLWRHKELTASRLYGRGSIAWLITPPPHVWIGGVYQCGSHWTCVWGVGCFRRGGGVVYSSLVFVDSFNLVVETLFSVIFDEVFTNGVTLQRSRNTQNELFFCKSGETPEWIDNDESYEVIITPYKVTFVQSIYEDVGCSDLIGDYNDNISNSTAWPELTVNFSTFNLQTINF